MDDALLRYGNDSGYIPGVSYCFLFSGLGDIWKIMKYRSGSV